MCVDFIEEGALNRQRSHGFTATEMASLTNIHQSVGFIPEIVTKLRASPIGKLHLLSNQLVPEFIPH